MKHTLRLLLTLFTILCSTTISDASIQESQAGVVFEETGASRGEIDFFDGFNAPKKPLALPEPRVRGNPNTAPTFEKIVVDPKGNAIPLKPGESLTGSPDGRFIQVRDSAGNPTGVRIDGPHKPASHPDPRAQAPHAHVPGVTNPDGTPWLPVKQ